MAVSASVGTVFQWMNLHSRHRIGEVEECTVDFDYRICDIISQGSFGTLSAIQLMSRLHKTLLRPLGNQDCCSEYVEDTEDGENAFESSLGSTEDAGPSTWAAAGYENLGEWHEGRGGGGGGGGGHSPCPENNGAENRGLLQGDYVVPNVHHTLLTSHTMVESIEGDTAEILEGDLYSNREGRPALIISSTSWYELLTNHQTSFICSKESDLSRRCELC